MSDYDISILRDEGGSASALAFSRKPDAPAGQAEPLQRICDGCCKPLAGRQERFCGDRCRMRVWELAHPRQNRPTQPTLAFDPPPLPLRSLADPPKDQHGRLKRSCGMILGRLMAGPATGLELIQAGGGVRYGARLLELRKRGHVIESLPVDEGRGIWAYRLVTR